ncbi:TonB-dependent receptor [Sphingobium sp. TKS]|nr:TonB-dependent receptor [Sphingobium sp. TKS]
MRKILLAGVSAAWATFPAAGYAQNIEKTTEQSASAIAEPVENNDPMMEIVVTAQRRSEKLQNVGISVSAFSGETLRTAGITSSIEITKFTPGITASGAVGGQGMQFSIRGVTQSDYNDAIEGPVAVYIDDVYINSQQGHGMALFDLARVEALKGPQGTLFGRNATGGLVHFIVNKPELSKYGGYANATYGRFDQTTLEGALNIPIGDSTALRVSGTWDRHGAVWRNSYPAGMVTGTPLNFGASAISPIGQDLGGDDKLAGRAQLLVQPNDGLTIRLTGSALRQNLSSSPWTTSSVVPVVDGQDRVVGGFFASPTETRAAAGPNGQNYYNPAVLGFQGFLYSPNNDGHRAPGASWFGYVPVDIGERRLSEEFAKKNSNSFRAYNGALHIDADLGGAQLASVTSWSRYKKNFLLDGEASPVNAFDFGTRSNVRSISQELRLSGASGGVNWTTGAFYLDIDARNAQGLLGPAGSALGVAFGLPAGVDAMSVYRLKTRSVSLFGQLNWEFAPAFTLVVGGRLIREHQNYEFSSDAYADSGAYVIDTETALFPLHPSFQQTRTDWPWAGKAQLEYRPHQGLLLYAGINRGVKAGSYNAKLADGSPPLQPSEIPYEPEALLSYEAGVKLTGPSNRYTLNLSVFHYDYKDYQSFTFTHISGLVQNRDARTNGVEVEATLRPFGGFNLSASVAYVDTKVKNVQVAPGVSRDARPTYAPEFSGSLVASYTLPAMDGDLTIGGNLSHQSSVYHNARNFQSQKISGRTLTDFSVRWESQSGLSLSAFLKNAFDKRYKTVGLDLATACGCNVEAYGMPRTWGIMIGQSF